MSLKPSDYKALDNFGVNRDEADALDLIWNHPAVIKLLDPDILILRATEFSMVECVNVATHSLKVSEARFALTQGFTMHQFHLIKANDYPLSHLLTLQERPGVSPIARDIKRTFLTNVLLANDTIEGVNADLATYRAARSGEPGPDGVTRTPEEVVAAVEALLAFKTIQSTCRCDT